MDTKDKVKVLDKALDILECFAETNRELTTTDLSKLTGLSTTTVFRIVKTLEARHYLHQYDNKRYTLGIKLTHLSAIGHNANLEELKKIAQPFMAKLRDQINESISIYVRDGFKRICITRLESTNSLRQVIRVGDFYDLNIGATGKLLIAYTTGSIQERILSHFPNLSKEDLYVIRQAGYAISSGERAEGVSAIAVPILGPNNEMIAALSLSGPTSRLLSKDLDDKIIKIKQVGHELSMAWQKNK